MITWRGGAKFYGNQQKKDPEGGGEYPRPAPLFVPAKLRGGGCSCGGRAGGRIDTRPGVGKGGGGCGWGGGVQGRWAKACPRRSPTSGASGTATRWSSSRAPSPSHGRAAVDPMRPHRTVVLLTGLRIPPDISCTSKRTTYQYLSIIFSIHN